MAGGQGDDSMGVVPLGGKEIQPVVVEKGVNTQVPGDKKTTVQILRDALKIALTGLDNDGKPVNFPQIRF